MLSRRSLIVALSLTRRQRKTRYLYEKVYCARGDMENRIKECQLDLYADRGKVQIRSPTTRFWRGSFHRRVQWRPRRSGNSITVKVNATTSSAILDLRQQSRSTAK